jgi:hypothetical protein
MGGLELWTFSWVFCHVATTPLQLYAAVNFGRRSYHRHRYTFMTSQFLPPWLPLSETLLPPSAFVKIFE